MAGINLDNILIFIAIAVFTIALGITIRMMIQNLFTRRLEHIKNSRLFARAIEYTIFFIGFYIGLNSLIGFNPLAFAASLGLITVAIAFSSQQLIQNFIGGILIALIRPIRLDDWVEIGNSGLCSVQDITLTYTLLHNLDGRLILMPNSSVLSQIIANYTKSGHVQIPVRIDIPANANIARVHDIVHRVLDSIEKIHHPTPNEQDMPFAHLLSRFQTQMKRVDPAGLEPRMVVVNISPSTITLEVRIWIDDFRRRDAIKGQLMEALNSNLFGVENPVKVDDKMLDVMRQMLEEMRERQTRLEELVAQRDVEELKTR